ARWSSLTIDIGTLAASGSRIWMMPRRTIIGGVRFRLVMGNECLDSRWPIARFGGTSKLSRANDLD
ncbi:MAG: hypothetical protein JRC86_13540, partial [Deltaproteobacteria bacterium]|nr:hypothetical protein [Deltaproteobacteria bacterium]